MEVASIPSYPATVISIIYRWNCFAYLKYRTDGKAYEISDFYYKDSLPDKSDLRKLEDSFDFKIIPYCFISKSGKDLIENIKGLVKNYELIDLKQSDIYTSFEIFNIALNGSKIAINCDDKQLVKELEDFSLEVFEKREKDFPFMECLLQAIANSEYSRNLVFEYFM